MAPKKWRGQTATLEVTDTSLASPAIGVLQDVTVTPQQETQELRGAGDVRWQDIMRTSVGIEITGTVASWAIDTWDVLVDFDEAAGGLDSGADLPTFTVTVGWEAADGSTKDIQANPAYMDPPPEIGGGRDEWVNMSLTFKAKEITSITNTDTTTA